MPITFNQEQNHELAAKTSTKIMDTLSGNNRLGAAFQLQDPGEVWLSSTSPAVIGQGLRLVPWEVKCLRNDFRMGMMAGFAPDGEEYAGEMYAIWNPGAKGGVTPATGTLRVLETGFTT